VATQESVDKSGDSWSTTPESKEKGMPQSKLIEDAPYAHLTYQINGAAMAVHRRMASGHKEQVYQHALEHELTRHGLSFEPQKNIEVYDEGVLVGLYILDFLVEGGVVVEIKALSGLDNSHVAQVIAYLTATGCPVGLLINFGERSLRFRRILPPHRLMEHRINRQWLFVPDWLKG
jgi:GxxExxY protein